MRPIDADLAPIYLNEQGCKMIKDMPTLSYKDLVPQGEWITEKEHDDYTAVKCTACGGILLVKWSCEIHKYRHCPNCGARMKGAD